MRVLLTGANGQLGRCLQDKISDDWNFLALNSSMLNISNSSAVYDIVSDFRPDFIINSAAYTAVDKAEEEIYISSKVNAHGSENLALAAKETGAKLVHISTDYVFDGAAKSPYVETDSVNPLGAYGRSKLAGELLVQLALPQAIIIRTSWVFSEYGNNFLKTMLRLGKEKDTLNIVADQKGCPTYAGDIAEAIISLIKNDAKGGIYHYCGDKSTTWKEFAQEIFRQALEQNKLLRSPQLNSISTEQYPTPATRPAYSTLDTSKIQKLGIRPSDWQSAIGTVLAKL